MWTFEPSFDSYSTRHYIFWPSFSLKIEPILYGKLMKSFMAKFQMIHRLSKSSGKTWNPNGWRIVPMRSFILTKQRKRKLICIIHFCNRQLWLFLLVFNLKLVLELQIWTVESLFLPYLKCFDSLFTELIFPVAGLTFTHKLDFVCVF